MANNFLTHLWLASTFLLFALASPIPLPDPVSSPQGFALPITKDARRSLSKRNPFAAPLALAEPDYVIDLRIGTPKSQLVGVSIDTGSSKTWVPNGNVCDDDKDCPQAYCEFFSYSDFVYPTILRSEWLIVRDIVNEDQSNTYQLNTANALSVTYGELTIVGGDTFTDTLTINGVTIQNADLGLARTVQTLMTDIVGVMGLGFDNSVATLYPSIIRNMLTNQIIANPVYSLWLSPGKFSSNIKLALPFPNKTHRWTRRQHILRWH
jgi:hypothetical protein